LDTPIRAERVQIAVNGHPADSKPLDQFFNPDNRAPLHQTSYLVPPFSSGQAWRYFIVCGSH
jgi:hypothetical protein